MKKFSKIAAVVALMLVVCLSFTGCGNLGNAIISALSLDVTVDDPALIKVEDILDKTVKTESVKSGDFTYTLYTDNTACITGYTGSNPVVSIPAEIDGAKVVGLENKALKSSSTLKELILPDSVEAIGNYAAMYCDSLEKVTIGKNIKHIGISAFEGSQENAYTGKSKLTTVVFNGAPKTISEKAFYFCSALTEIVLPEGVETIGDRGWLAIALVIFAVWKPDLGILGSFLFGGLMVVHNYIPNLSFGAQELFMMTPYVVTIIVLVAVSMRRKRENLPPASLGLSYFREDR